MRGLRLLAALTLLAGAGGACTSSATSYSSPAVSTASPSSTPDQDRSAAADGPPSAPQPASPGGAQPASVPVDLALTGALSGHVASARTVAQCGVGQVGFAAQLELVVNGRPYLLGFQIVDFHGPGDYPVPPIRASLRPVSPGSSGGLLPAVAGHVSIAANQRSGRLQLTLGPRVRLDSREPGLAEGPGSTTGASWAGLLSGGAGGAAGSSRRRSWPAGACT